MVLVAQSGWSVHKKPFGRISPVTLVDSKPAPGTPCRGKRLSVGCGELAIEHGVRENRRFHQVIAMRFLIFRPVPPGNRAIAGCP